MITFKGKIDLFLIFLLGIRNYFYIKCAIAKACYNGLDLSLVQKVLFSVLTDGA